MRVAIRCGGRRFGVGLEGQRVAKGRRAWQVVAMAAALVVVVSSVGSAQDAAAPPGPSIPGQPTEAPTEPVAAAELAALAQARAVVAGRMVTSAGAEGARRRAEEAVVEAHRQVRSAEQDLAHVNVMLDGAIEALDVARDTQQKAQEIFDRNVATSYKFTGAQSSALLLTALQSATDAHDLARAVGELDNVLGHSFADLERHMRATALAEDRVETLTRLRGVAYLAVQDAEAAVAPVADAADSARSRARGAEAALLDAAARALDAEQAALDAGAPPDQVAGSGAGDPLAPGTAPVAGEAGPSLEQRRAWLANRRGVVAGQARLPAEAWAVRRDLTCPIEDATFGNDFHFPRSHGRRHLGTDVFAPSGTPIVALAAGEVVAVDASDGFDGDHDLGGVTVAWETEVGRFYAAHLLRIPDGLAVGDHVEAGEVVGYVGSTGNARGGAAHLHLGWSVDGVDINPWPTLAYVCDPDGTE